MEAGVRKIDRYTLQVLWQALNCFSIHATYCVIVAGASPGETIMWAAVRENSDFFAVAVRKSAEPEVVHRSVPAR